MYSSNKRQCVDYLQFFEVYENINQLVCLHFNVIQYNINVHKRKKINRNKRIENFNETIRSTDNFQKISFTKWLFFFFFFAYVKTKIRNLKF